jgi:hypothetical protein
MNGKTHTFLIFALMQGRGQYNAQFSLTPRKIWLMDKMLCRPKISSVAIK